METKNIKKIIDFPQTDVLKAFQAKMPPVLDFIVIGFLNETVGALIGMSASGKSLFALELAMAVSCGGGNGDVLRINPEKAGRVVYLALEDGQDAILSRLWHIGKYLSEYEQEAIAKNLIVSPIADLSESINIGNSKHVWEITQFCMGSRLIIIDTLSLIHCKDENSNSDMAQMINVLKNIAKTTHSAVLFLHHTNKTSNSNGTGNEQGAARGASALVSNIRWAGFISSMTAAEASKFGITENRKKFYVKFGVSKQSYSSYQSEQWYERMDGGVLVPTELAEKQAEKQSKKQIKPKEESYDEDDFI